MIRIAHVVTLVTTTLASLAIGACAGSAAPDASTQNALTARAGEPAPDLAGTWAFDLEASDASVPLREKCVTQAAGDASKQAACWSEVSREAKLEKIRFSKTSEGGRALWTSFGVQGPSETVFVEVPVELSADGSSHVLAKVVGKPTGAQAARFAEAAPSAMRIELVDARTIAMTDPTKGRLVFSKE